MNTDYKLVHLYTPPKDKILKVKDSIKAMKEMPVPSDPQVAKDVDELFNIQIQRANFMADGVRGDTSKFAVGGQYYDMFYEKLAAFKKAHGVN